jgi:glucokinase
MANKPVYVGIDIGGTKVAAGIVNEKGEIVSQIRVPMNSTGEATDGLAAVKAAIDKISGTVQGATIAAIGVSSPGPLDPRSGVVINPPNVPCWRNFPLKAEIERAYGLPVTVDNDANAAGLAEALWGAGVGYSSVFYTTLGTGIGTGIVLDGQVYYGRTGAAAEGGHTTIDYRGPYPCGCGKTGCIEAMASGPAIARRARAKVTADPSGGKALLNIAQGEVNRITAEIVSHAWRAGDAMAAEVLEETADVLTVWLGNIIDLLEPDVIVVGGGVGELMSNFFDHISSKLPKWSINQRCTEISMKLARYMEHSGVAGAAALCLGRHVRADSAAQGISGA